MITQATARRIDEVCDEIRSCKIALEQIRKEDPPLIYVNVKKSGKEDWVTPQMTGEIVTEALRKQIKVLEAYYASLNKKAIEEANKPY